MRSESRKSHYIEHYAKRPAPPSVYHKRARVEGAWAMGLLGAVLLFVVIGLVGGVGGLFLIALMFWIVGVSRGVVYLKMWRMRKACDYVWQHEPEWALKTLVDHHQRLTLQEPQDIILRREHHVQALKAMIWLVPAGLLSALILVLSEGHVIAFAVSAIMCLIVGLRVFIPALRHSNQKSKMRDYALQRETFRRATHEIAEDKTLLGALSAPIAEMGGEMSLITHEGEHG